MRTAKFSRTKEDFLCENCGAKVQGNGYTNHCPRCLWSKHVDEQPGDRAHHCGGLMEPFELWKKGSKLTLEHRCSKCGMVKRNKVSEHDDREKLLKLPLK